MEHPHIAFFRASQPAMMVWVLDDVLGHESIVGLCTDCSIRNSSLRIPKRRMVTDLVEAFYRNDRMAGKIAEVLAEGNRNFSRGLEGLSPSEVEAMASDQTALLREGTSGRLLHALATDPRAEIRGLATALLSGLTSSGQDRDGSGTRMGGEAEGRMESRLADLTKTNEELREELVRARQTLNVAEDEREASEARVEGLVEEGTSLRRRVLDLQRDLAAAQTAQRHAEEEISKLRQRPEPPPPQEPPRDAALQSVHHLVREHKKIQYSLEKIEKWIASGSPREQGPDRFMEALGDTVMEVKQLVTREIIDNGRERNEVRRNVEDLRAELRGIQAEFRRALEVDKRPVRMPGDAERVGVFVDVQNIFYAAKQFNARLDFEKLLRTATDNRRLIRAIAYVVQSPEVDQSGFITMLQQKSYEVKRKDLRLRSDGSAKGDWDMGMAIDIIDLAKRLDIVVLVSGDGDFVSLVNLIKTIGPRVEVYSFVHNTARDLVQAADAHFQIDESLLLRLNGEYVSARQQREAADASRAADPSGAAEPLRLAEVARGAELVRAVEPVAEAEGKD